MKKLANLIKEKYLLATLILLGAYITFQFVYLVSSENDSFSTWIMFLVNAGLVALVVLGLFLKKKEFVLVPFVVFGVSTLYGVITELSGYTTFVNELKNLPSAIKHYTDLSKDFRVNVPTILGDFTRGTIGLAGLASFVLLILGKVVLKKDKLVKPAYIVLSLIPVAFLAYSVLAMVSAICGNIWYDKDLPVLAGSFGDTYFLYLISRAFLWAAIACVAYLGLPEKVEAAKEEAAKAEEPAPAAEAEVPVEETKTEEPAEEKAE